jgi:TM2 domain-containing membrane protein YozV
MDREADLTYKSGAINYNVAWALLTFFGILGIHRIYMGKIVTGIIYFFSGGLFGVGLLYDFITLNEQISQIQRTW